MIKYLKPLCLENGVSGNEKNVAQKIISFLPSDCKTYTDPLNNLIVEKKGNKRANKKILLTAHMDEVGFMVLNILDDGSILFANVGGLNVNTIVGTKVKIGDVVGVIGVKPIHLQDKNEREKSISFDDLFIDIGAKSKKEAESRVSIGMQVTFLSDFVEFGNSKVKAKAIDDRFGCSLLLKLLNEYDNYDLNCAFLVQEEIGLIGAKTIAYSTNPQYAIVFDATTACDLANIEDDKKVCLVNGGIVVPFMDKSTIYDKELFDLAFSLAKENNIKIQTKTTIAGSNDSFAISSSQGGVKTISLSLPCRYIHSQSCVASTEDMKSGYSLATKMVDCLSCN